MGRKARIVNRITQRLAMRRIGETGQVDDHILPAVLNLIAYVPLQKVSNIERRIPLSVAGALDIPVLSIRIGTVTPARQAVQRTPQFACLFQSKYHMRFLQRPKADPATLIRICRQLQLSSSPVFSTVPVQSNSPFRLDHRIAVSRCRRLVQPRER